MKELLDLIGLLEGIRRKPVLFVKDGDLKSGILTEIHLVISESPTYILCHVMVENEVYRLGIDEIYDAEDKIELESHVDIQISKLEKAKDDIANLIIETNDDVIREPIKE